MDQTRESQYSPILEHHKYHGPVQMGMCTSHTWDHDPKRLGFILARYKFVGKMLIGKENVLEIGCGDGFGSRIVKQLLGGSCQLIATDFDPIFIENARKTNNSKYPVNFELIDFLDEVEFSVPFDAIYCLDVLEHIPEYSGEPIFIENVLSNLKENGVFIVGMPSLESQSYASQQSKEGHVNCKTQEQLKLCMLKYFENVFLFGFNDESLTTGFGPMCHYNIAICVGVKNERSDSRLSPKNFPSI